MLDPEYEEAAASRERNEELDMNPDYYMDDEGYDLDDPKHSTYHERMSSLWDDQDKTQGH